MTRDELLIDGFLPLIEYEEVYDDKLLIHLPRITYRRSNEIVKLFGGKAFYFEIVDIKVDSFTGYRIPTLKSYNEA